MVLHGEIGELGKKRGRTEINVMLKEETCNHQENKRKKRKILVPKKKFRFVPLKSAQCDI